MADVLVVVLVMVGVDGRGVIALVVVALAAMGGDTVGVGVVILGCSFAS